MNTAPVKTNYKVWLNEELNHRKLKNPSYSLRAFAKTLGLPVSSLSQILLGNRPLTLKAAKRIAKGLELDPKETQDFIESALRPTLSANALNHWEGSSLTDLEVDKFKMISEWYHFGILGLAALKENRFNADWISQMLRISKKEANEALDRLLRLGFIQRKGRRFVQALPPFQVSAPKGSASIRRFHRDTLRLAESSLENHSVEEREFNSITFAASQAKLPEAKKRIIKFRNELSEFLEAGNQERVFMLNIQLFPISKNEGVKK